MQLVLLVLLGLALAPSPSAALRLLGLFPIPVHSHYAMFKAMMNELVERGHEVVVFTHFPSKEPRANLTEVDTSRGMPSLINTYTFEELKKPMIEVPVLHHAMLMPLLDAAAGNHRCHEVFSMPEFQKVMNGGYGKFDAVFYEIFGSDCYAAVPYKLQIPLISMSSAPDVSWMHDRIGSIDNPSYLVNVFSDHKAPMTFFQRVSNLLNRVVLNAIHASWMEDGADEVVRQYFGPDVPPVRELLKNTSLVLLNRHVSIHSARPVTPNLVHVGGLHVKGATGSLDPKIRQWMDEAKHGVIYFSMGALIRSSSMPDYMRDALLGAFAELPQRVLWKHETDDFPLPPNVRIVKWLPQMDVLTHPKTVLFITHGGLMGTLESLHSGVPMIGIPVFADQHTNMELYMSLGIAEQMDYETMTKQSVLQTITKLTKEKRYRERAREVAALFRDRPRQAADEAVWWVEYVVRNHGAKHLRPLGADMPLYQYLLLDVVAFLAAALLLTVWLLWRLVRRVVSALSGSRSAKKKGD